MNETANEPQKTTVIKTLAIIGFIVALIFVAWLAVQTVRLVPAAFTTLASIADGLKNKESDFTIATGTNIINTGETLTISWTKPAQDGIYVFSYKCTDGVVAEMRDTAGHLSAVPCETKMPVGQNENSVAVIFSSEKGRFVDVPYTIAFTPDGTDLANERSGIITVVNPGIRANGNSVASNIHADDNSQTNTVVATGTDTHTATEPPTPAPTSNTAVPKPKPILYKTVPTVVATMPVSNPSGHPDLAVTFTGVGTYNASTNTFSPQTSLIGNAPAALRFEVKNIGTKTSGNWYFSASLPTTPTFTYSSSVQTALKPNERQVIMLQFTATSGASTQTVTVAVTGGNDTALANNVFTRQISVSN